MSKRSYDLAIGDYMEEDDDIIMQDRSRQTINSNKTINYFSLLEMIYNIAYYLGCSQNDFNSYSLLYHDENNRYRYTVPEYNTSDLLKFLKKNCQYDFLHIIGKTSIVYCKCTLESMNYSQIKNKIDLFRTLIGLKSLVVLVPKSMILPLEIHYLEQTPYNNNYTNFIDSIKKIDKDIIQIDFEYSFNLPCI